MQKARIVSDSKQDASNFAEQLRRRGYDVEVATPGDHPNTDVDVEIELQTCPKEQVLARAGELASSINADVYIAPGCLQTIDVAGSDQLSSPSLADLLSGISAGLQNKRDLMAKALREQRAMTRRGRRPQQEADASEQEPAEIYTPMQSAPEILPQFGTAALSSNLSPEPRSSEVEIGEPGLTENSVGGFQLPAPIPPSRPVARPHRPRPSNDLRVVFGISTVCAVVMMFGWSALAHGPALPRTLSNFSESVEQTLPFAPAVAKPEHADSKAPVQAEAMSRHFSSVDVSPAEGPKNQKLPARLVKERPVRHGVSSVHDGLVAEDEVRRVAPKQPEPARTPPSTASRARLRHISDE